MNIIKTAYKSLCIAFIISCFANIRLQAMDLELKQDEVKEIPALCMAAAQGYVPEVVRLLDAGADINCCDLNKKTPLCHAIIGGHDTIVELLLARKAAVDIHCILKADELSQLMRYMVDQNRDSEYFKALRSVIDLISFSDTEVSLLSLATRYRRVRCIQLLLSNGCPVWEKDFRNATALFLATMFGFTDVVKAILESKISHCLILKIDETMGVDALTAARINGCREIVDLLIQAGAPANSECTGPLLFNMIAQGNIEETCRLLDAGVHLSELRINENLACVMAAAAARSHGLPTPPSSQIPSFIHPLMPAIRTGNLQMLRMLRNRGLDIRSQLPNDLTALMLAAMNADPAVIEYLVAEGLPVNHTNPQGLSALACAAEIKNFKNAAALCKQGAKLTSKL